MIRPLTFRSKLTPDIVVAVAVSCLPLIYFLPALRGDIVLCPYDGIIFGTPLRVAAAQIARHGHPPLWNPYIFSGMPLLATAQGGLLFPLNWFYLIFSAPVATNLMVVSSYVLAALGAYLYARRRGATLAGAMTTSLAWQWGGFLIGQLSHINIVQTAAMIPWVLWSLDGYGLTGRRRWGVLLAVFVALQTFVGHQQTLAYSLLLIAAYAVAAALANKQSRVNYLRSLVFVAAGVLLAAVQILPTFELLRNSPRSEATYDFFTSFSMPFGQIKTFLAPYIMGGGDGHLFRAPYVGPQFYGELVGYVGSLTIMLALVAVLLKRDAQTKFWAVAALAGLTLALGRYAPLGIYRLIYHVPVLNLFRVPARHLMEAEFALAVLAGRGLTALAAARGDPLARRRVAVIGAVIFLLTCLVVSFGRPANFQLGRQAEVSFLRAPEFFIPVLIAALSACVLWVFAGARRGATALMLAILALDLAVWGQSSGWRLSSPRSGDEVWRVPEAVKLLGQPGEQEAASYRILTVPHTFDPALPPVPPSVSHATDENLWTQPDIYMLYGIQNAAGYDGFGLARYSHLAGEMKVWGELTDPNLTLRGDSREIDLLNVHYLLSMRKPNAVPAVSQLFPPATQSYGGLRFADSDLGLPSMGAGKRLRFSIPPVEADRVSLVTNLAWSEKLRDGAPVGRVRLSTRDGRNFEFALRAGTNTAEWAYDRPDIHSRIRHSRPEVAASYNVSDARGQFAAHSYLGSFTLPEKVTVTGAEIVVERSAEAPDLLLGVFRVSLVDSLEARTYPLRRDWIETDAPSGGRDLPAGSSRWRLFAETADVDIYQNMQALPRAWLTSATYALDDQSMLDVVRTGRLPDGSRWEPRRTALVDPKMTTQSAAGLQEQRAEVTRYEPNRVEVKTSSSVPSILVLSENHYPGWRAYLDGSSVGVLRVDYALRGVSLPAGQHVVEFVYRPKSVLIGLIVSTFVALALVCWWAGLLPEDRVRRVLGLVAPHEGRRDAEVQQQV